MSRGSCTYQEIISQGEAWRESLEAVQAESSKLLDLLRRPRAQVVFTGCGSTYYLSLTAAAIWQALTGTQARGVPSSELWLFPETVLTAQPSLLVSVSRSAETTETLMAEAIYRERTGSETLAVTCYADRDLASHASQVLVAKGAEESSIAQTRAFTAMLVLTQVAAGLAGNHPEFLAQLDALPQSVGPLIERYEPLARRLASDSGLERFVFLGSGPNYGLACEAMLKMKEMSLSPSEAFHFMEFRHGPKSVVAPGTLIVGLLSESAGRYESEVLREMRSLGAKILAIAETAEGLPADYAVELRSGLGDLARGPLLLPVLQLLAFHRAVERDLDPDRPTNLDAVVRL